MLFGNNGDVQHIFNEDFSFPEFINEFFKLGVSFSVYFFVAFDCLLSSCIPFGYVRVFVDIKSQSLKIKKSCVSIIIIIY